MTEKHPKHRGKSPDQTQRRDAVKDAVASKERRTQLPDDKDENLGPDQWSAVGAYHSEDAGREAYSRFEENDPYVEPAKDPAIQEWHQRLDSVDVRRHDEEDMPPVRPHHHHHDTPLDDDDERLAEHVAHRAEELDRTHTARHEMRRGRMRSWTVPVTDDDEAHKKHAEREEARLTDDEVSRAPRSRDAVGDELQWIGQLLEQEKAEKERAAKEKAKKGGAAVPSL